MDGREDRDLDYFDDTDFRDDDPDLECCDHDDSELDILTGRASCYRCGHRWRATADEIESRSAQEHAYAEWVAEQERPWNRFREWFSDVWSSLKRRVRRSPADDEIPF